MKTAATIHAAPRLALYATVVTAALAIAACGNDTSGNSAIDISGIVTDQSRASQSATTVPTRTPVARSDVQASSSSAVVDIISAEGQYTPVDIENLDSFKKSKSYDISGLRDATDAVYGFFGTDPYNRREVEIRFYPDHETALDSGVDFADEATGPIAIVTSSAQRWDEGITQRRACRANTRGSHHTGRCDAAKYGDYIVFGNLIVLCEGLDSQTALANCNEFADVLQ